MPNSYAVKVQITCPTTSNPFDFEVWMIVDTTERPDLVAKIREGKLYEVVSPYTNKVVEKVDAPLLIFQPDKQPVLIFSPIEESTQDDIQLQCNDLVNLLAQILGKHWQDSWVERGVNHIQRALLSIAIDDFSKVMDTLKNLSDELENISNILPNIHDRPYIYKIPYYIKLYKIALSILPRVGNEEVWADLQIKLGYCFLKNLDGNVRHNIKEAKIAYQRALTVITQTTTPIDWAMIMNNLGIACSIDDKSESIEDAIGYYNQALTIRTRDAMPIEWAETIHNLALAYRKRIRGNKSENIELAIGYYNQALTIRTRDAMPIEWAETIHNLADAYQSRIKGNKAQNIELAINHYKQMLTLITFDNMPLRWASAIINLGISYYSRIKGNKSENIELAIECYQQALTVLTCDDTPVEYARAIMNLASAYKDTIKGNRSKNIEQAIDWYQQVLSINTKDAMPIEWVQTMINLAVTYRYRIKGDKSENIEQSINYNNEALTIATRSSTPIYWAMIMHNLAISYKFRLKGNRSENIEQAINYCQQALTVRTQDTMPFEWAQTMNNLAIAYRNRIKGNINENIEQAISCYRQILLVLTRDDMPAEWSQIMNNIAAAYQMYTKDYWANNIEIAIDCYKQALKVRTKTAMPIEWAETITNLAVAYYSRAKGNKIKNIKKAIDYYYQALTIRTFLSSPKDHQDTLRNLNTLYFENYHWQNVITTSRQIIAVGKDIFVSAYTDEGRHSALSDSGLAYTQLSYALIQLGQYDEALLALDAGKARLLAEALSFGDANLAELTLQEREKIQHYRDDITSLEYEYRLPPNHPSRRDERLITSALHDARSALRNYLDSLKTRYPNLMPEGIPLADLLALIPEKMVLVAPVFTTQGSAVFIIPHGTTAVSQQHVLILDGVTTDTLYQMTIGTEENPGWLMRYVTRKHPDLLNAIDEIGQSLWDTLIGQVHEQVQALGEMAQIIIMPQGNLGLLPVHVGWRMVEGQKRYWLDDYVITYATSGYSLASAQKHDVTGRDALIVGVGEYPNPKHNLPNTVAEANAIASLFNTPSITNANATVDKVKAEAHRANYLHLSCHGTFAWGGDIFNAGLLLHNAEMLNLAHIMTQLKLTGTRLVTLSACETGITDFNQASDEFLGLPAGFMQAGAMGVVSSLWTVEDRSTALLMGQFYRKHINEGMHPAIALREAQDWIRKATVREIGDYYQSFLRMSKEDAQTGAVELFMKNLNPDDKPYEHPFYWSAFTYTGI